MSQLRGFSLWEKTPPWIRRGWGFSQGLSLSWGALKCKSTCKPLRACPFPPPFPLPSSPFLPTSITSSSSPPLRTMFKSQQSVQSIKLAEGTVPCRRIMTLWISFQPVRLKPQTHQTAARQSPPPALPTLNASLLSALLNLTTRFPHKRNCVVFMLCDCFCSVCVEYTPGAC